VHVALHAPTELMWCRCRRCAQADVGERQAETRAHERRAAPRRLADGEPPWPKPARGTCAGALRHKAARRCRRRLAQTPHQLRPVARPPYMYPVSTAPADPGACAHGRDHACSQLRGELKRNEERVQVKGAPPERQGMKLFRFPIVRSSTTRTTCPRNRPGTSTIR
jgi:hypothetical protein